MLWVSSKRHFRLEQPPNGVFPLQAKTILPLQKPQTLSSISQGNSSKTSAITLSLQNFSDHDLDRVHSITATFQAANLFRRNLNFPILKLGSTTPTIKNILQLSHLT
jgi:hypothetical protein